MVVNAGLLLCIITVASGLVFSDRHHKAVESPVYVMGGEQITNYAPFKDQSVRNVGLGTVVG